MSSTIPRSLLIIVTAMVLLAGNAVAQKHSPVAERPLLAPAKSSLLPVPLPSLDGVESVVAEQIRSFQNLSAQLIIREDATDDEIAQAYGALAQLYHAYEMNGAAEAAYQNAHQLAPQDYRWPHLLGHLSHQTGHLQASAGYFRKVRQLRPDYAAAAARLADVLLQLDRPEEARAEFRAALATDPQMAAAHAGLGETALADRNYAEAVEHFLRALERVPAANRLHYSLGMAYRGLGDMEKARWHLEQRGKVGVRPTDPLVDGLDELLLGERVQMVRGQLAFSAGRYQEAATAFSTALEADPNSTRARVNLGTALAKLGDAQGAIEQFQEVLRRDPDSATAHFNLATFMLRQDNPEQATNHFREFLRINPADAEANHELGKLLARSGHDDEALDHFLRAVKLRPDSENYLLDLAALLARRERYGEALERLEGFHQRLPDRGLTAHALARLLAACPDVSLRNGQRALELATRVFEARSTVSHGETVVLAMAELGRCEEAATWQNQLIATAGQADRRELVTRLKKDLSRYESGPPCRPPAKHQLNTD